MKQTTLGSTDWALKTKVTRRARFLFQMEAVAPWARPLAVIEPHYPNAAQERDPEMKQTRKGRQWRFGMKLHVGTDRRGLVHIVATGPASQGHITRLDDLMHGQQRGVVSTPKFNASTRAAGSMTGCAELP